MLPSGNLYGRRSLEEGDARYRRHTARAQLNRLVVDGSSGCCSGHVEGDFGASASVGCCASHHDGSCGVDEGSRAARDFTDTGAYTQDEVDVFTGGRAARAEATVRPLSRMVQDRPSAWWASCLCLCLCRADVTYAFFQVKLEGVVAVGAATGADRPRFNDDVEQLTGCGACGVDHNRAGSRVGRAIAATCFGVAGVVEDVKVEVAGRVGHDHTEEPDVGADVCVQVVRAGS